MIANDFLQIRKVIEHVYEKVICGSEAGSSAGSPTGEHRGSNAGTDGSRDRDQDSAVNAEDKVELLCNEKVLDPNLDLRTVKSFIWKSTSDLVLHYKPLRPVS